MQFAADAMLGRLARWLRLSGYSVYYSRTSSDEDLLKRAMKQGLVLLTRDGALAGRAEKLGIRVVLIHSTDVEEQLLQLADELGLRYECTPVRALCPLCNGPLVEVGKEEVRGKLPAGVVESVDTFYRCSRCGKYYWHGTHWKNIAQRVERIGGRLQASREG
ncbi:Mut7-C RNAse domain-containing protein [Candidatus Pyrohabitans sp.]